MQAQANKEPVIHLSSHRGKRKQTNRHTKKEHVGMRADRPDRQARKQAGKEASRQAKRQASRQKRQVRNRVVKFPSFTASLGDSGALLAPRKGRHLHISAQVLFEDNCSCLLRMMLSAAGRIYSSGLCLIDVECRWLGVVRQV